MAKRITEAQFLADQAAVARAKMGTAIQQLAHEVTDQGDPRRWIRRHPWTSLATAAGAGIGLGYSVSSKRTRARPDPAWPGPYPEAGPARTPQGSSVARLILLPLFASFSQAAKVALNRFLSGLVESMLASASAPQATGPSAEADAPEQEASAAI